MTPPRKPENSADGCRASAQADLVKAAATPNPQVRKALERSANAWAIRAELLERMHAKLEPVANARRNSAKDPQER